ncbi:hypothetical protein Mal33_37540 [Rosistilla oblonga]|uniref:Uncharacterized protein n=1 Tax=Rosistilla oblonga TaxID=2527990 RepID=A0A518IXC8_9BACT|nr:hypothetical protein Mal33_37540 [Rosistilla oblonga]
MMHGIIPSSRPRRKRFGMGIKMQVQQTGDTKRNFALSAHFSGPASVDKFSSGVAASVRLGISSTTTLHFVNFS